MAIASMTGFARTQGHAEDVSWTWEVKSVNGKGLDSRCRLPGGLEGLEPPVRERVSRRFARGNVSLTLSVVWTRPAGAWRINEDLLDHVAALLPRLRHRVPDATPASLDGLLNLRGVLEPVEQERSEDDLRHLEAVLLAGLDQALDALEAMRAAEGERLATLIDGHLAEIERLCAEAAGLAAAQPAAIAERLRAQVQALVEAVPAVPAERLAQEAALLMTKADVREELDRLGAHLAAARDLCGQGSPVGRKLDFLCQEFNREANTLCSKSADVDLTRTGLDLKAAIDQLREQVQNIE